MAASLAAVLVGCPIRERTQQWSLIFPGHPDSLAELDLTMFPCVRAAAMKLGFCFMTMAASGITTSGTLAIPETTMNAIIAISSMISILLRSAFLIGGTQATDTSTANIPTRMDIPTRMRLAISHRLTVTNIGKIWR
jgi:hypothetical protein